MKDDVFDLTGQVAFITTGATRISSATALLLARYGADIMVAGPAEMRAATIVEQARSLGRRALAITADASRPEDCERTIDRTVGDLGQIDILINDASEPFEQWDQAGWESRIAATLRGVFLMSQLVGRHMLSRKQGAIVNLAPIAGGIDGRQDAPYGTLRAGISNLTKALAAAWGPAGVRVNCIAVGAISSDVPVLNMPNALDRLGSPEEVAYPILFCASRAASFLTGETIMLAGGAPVLPLA